MKRTIVAAGAVLAAVLFLLHRAARLAPAQPATGFDFAVWLAVSLLVFVDLLDILVRLHAARLTASRTGTSMELDVGEFTPQIGRASCRERV